MDSKSQDHKSELPSRVSRDELEEALKWLEELTNRKGAASEPANPVPSATIESPFRGLIENDEGDLPDWLREVPSTPYIEGLAETEPESRLDWLAKMTQRESIEELPTLEWRRIGEPMQSALLPPERGVTADVKTDADQSAEAVEPAFSPEADPVRSRTPEDPLAWLGPDTSQADTPELIDSPLPDEPEGPDLTLPATEPEPEDETPSADDLDAAMAWIEELAASQDAPIEDIPSVVDRALASKLLMETGIDQVMLPLDELGSDSDMAGDMPMHPFIQEEDLADTVILVETMAAEQRMAVDIPSDPAVPDTPKAAPVVLLHGEDHEANIEFALIDEPVDPFDPSFEEAMAFLEEKAAERQPELSQPGSEDSTPVVTRVDEVIATAAASLPEPEIVDERIVTDEFESISHLKAQARALAAEDVETFSDYIDDDSEPSIELQTGTGEADPLTISGTASETASATTSETEAIEPPIADFTPWVDAAESPAVDISEADTVIEAIPASLYKPTTPALEVALLALDALALPTGKTLDDIGASLRTAHVAPSHDISSALVWLESTLGIAQVEPVPPAETLEDEDLIAQMPEDPDAILAWLEQMADKEEAALEQPAIVPRDDSAAYAGSQYAANQLTEDWAATDLLSMPDDPDEAMAWLEGLARDETSARDQAVANVVVAFEVEAKQATGEPEVTDIADLEVVDDEAALLAEGEVEEIIADDPVKAVIDDIDATIDDIIAAIAGESAKSVAMPIEATVEDIEATVGEEIIETKDEVVEIVADPVEALIEDTGTTAEDIVESIPFVEAQVAESIPEPAEVPLKTTIPKRQRAKPAKAKVEEAAIDEQPQPDEPPQLSWVDLLKPLD